MASVLVPLVAAGLLVASLSAQGSTPKDFTVVGPVYPLQTWQMHVHGVLIVESSVGSAPLRPATSGASTHPAAAGSLPPQSVRSPLAVTISEFSRMPVAGQRELVADLVARLLRGLAQSMASPVEKSLEQAERERRVAILTRALFVPENRQAGENTAGFALFVESTAEEVLRQPDRFLNGALSDFIRRLDADLPRSVRGQTDEDQEAYYRSQVAAQRREPGEMNSLGVEADRRGDFATALRWYRRAAARGHANAMCNLASMYSSGDAVPESEQQAFDWYFRCAHAGNARGMAMVSLAYDTDPNMRRNFFPSMRKDAAAAFSWALRAAEHGNHVAMSNLARMYRMGQGTAANGAEVNRWMEAAVKARESANPFGADGDHGW
jgi:TPR repeat protein